MAGAVTALHAVGQWHTVLLQPYGVTYLCGRLVGDGYRTYGSCRTYLAALRTFGATIATFVGHFGLHQRHQTGGRTEYLVGADRHAKLAGGAMTGEIACAQGSGRNNRRGTFRNLLVFDDGKAAIHFLFLRFQCGGRGNNGRGGQERTAGIINLFLINLL